MQRCLCTLLAPRRAYSTALPWFVDEPLPSSSRSSLPRPAANVPDIPENTPQIIKQLHTQLAQSPHLDPSTLMVSESIAPPPGPPLPLRAPQGKRKRGGTYAGESAYDIPGEVWNWVLLTIDPPLPLPPNAKRRMHNGWAMIDAGDFAVHILSREAREKYFDSSRAW
ncbi:hypothetical protein C0989_011451 [Termitomyces sp. Mn162]|nr:hypothetical protein C0989_011451 [Termitomyces sp. Mn162]